MNAEKYVARKLAERRQALRKSNKKNKLHEALDPNKREFDLKFAWDATDLPEEIHAMLWEYADGYDIAPVRDDVPMPWDAGLSVQNGKLIIDGGVGPNGFGHCLCEVPIDKVESAYAVTVRPNKDALSNDGMSVFDLADALAEYGWTLE